MKPRTNHTASLGIREQQMRRQVAQAARRRLLANHDIGSMRERYERLYAQL